MKFFRAILIEFLNKFRFEGVIKQAYIQRRLYDKRLNQELLPILTNQLNIFLKQGLINYSAMVLCPTNSFDSLNIQRVSEDTLVGIFSNSKKPACKNEIYFFTYDLGNFYYHGSALLYIEGFTGPYYRDYFTDISEVSGVFMEIQMGYKDDTEQFTKTSSMGLQVGRLQDNSHKISKFISENIARIKNLGESPIFNFEFKKFD